MEPNRTILVKSNYSGLLTGRPRGYISPLWEDPKHGQTPTAQFERKEDGSGELTISPEGFGADFGSGIDVIVGRIGTGETA